MAGFGLTLLALSPFFNWVNIAGGGVIGLRGDGSIVLGVTGVALVAFVAVLFQRKGQTLVVLGVQAWATLAVFWMATHIWKVGSLVHSTDLKDNPFATLLQTQVSPGVGLYLGLFGGILVASSLGLVLIRRSLTSGNPEPYIASQGLSCVLGIVLVFVVGPRPLPRFPNPSAGGLMALAPPEEDPRTAQAQWRERYHVSDQQWDELLANFKTRKAPQSASLADWWREAKTKSPDQLHKLYPPPSPRERYRAEWPDGFRPSRELDFNHHENTHTLQVSVKIRTEPGVPLKELHGHLTIRKGDVVLYETHLAEKPRISFADTHFVVLRIPYDDNNPAHRTLRFAKDDELTPVFSVSKVLLADGPEMIFDQ